MADEFDSMDLYDKIRALHNAEKRTARRKSSKIMDPKKAALQDLLESVMTKDNEL
ncbi:MAG: hypothetical protein GXN99_02515 [Candidatus Nanohaloarchaeota archaeon]|nr:hypothetical protein [Candidatus Nanohaloarchaeota archaeon]